MDPISTAVTVIASVNQAITLTKTLRDADLKLNEAENRMKIADLYIQLSNILGDVAALKNEIIDKNEKITELQRQLKLTEEVVWKDPFCFRILPDGTKDGPFCQQCRDTTSKLVRLPKPDTAWHHCNACKSNYEFPKDTLPNFNQVDIDYDY